MIILIGAILALFYMIYTYYVYKDMPPGPYGLPIIGYAPFLGRKPHEEFKKLSQKYGGIFCVNLYGKPVVVVNDRSTIHEVLITKGSTFSGRPYMFLLKYLFEKKEIGSSDGAVWSEQKRFVHKIMREFGLGMNSMEGVVMGEVNKLVHKLKQDNVKEVQIKSLFFVPILNIVWGITAGKNFDLSEKATKRYKEALDYIVSKSASTTVLNFLPILRFIAPTMSGFKKISHEKSILLSYLRKEVDRHWNNVDSNRHDDMISRYIAEIKDKQYESNDKEYPPYDLDSLVYTAYDFFDAGTETITSTLQWGFLYMALWPDVQRKVQQELDSVMDTDSHLSYVSKGRVPYTVATLNEIQRCANVVPFATPHAPTKDTILCGYRIKKGTNVIPNLWGLHNDKEVWGDPQNFRPERFLDKDGKVKKHDCLLPFSAGPRFCLGKYMAQIQLFLFFTSLMRHFSFEAIPGKNKPSLEPVVGVTMHPQTYSLVLNLRKHS